MDQVGRCLKAARFYRDRCGWNPLPMKADRKQPSLGCFRRFLDHPVPDAVLRSWRSPGIQLCTGRRWGLVVVDIDGPLALEAWRSMTRFRNLPPTWTVLTGSSNPSTGDIGLHVYFSVDRDGPPLLTTHLWRLWDGSLRDGLGGYVPGVEIKLFGDRGLVVAPPSVHPELGNYYRWLLGPRDLRSGSALLPDFLVRIPHETSSGPNRSPSPVAVRPGRFGHHYDRDLVLAAIPDKQFVAQEAGVEFVNRLPRHGRWLDCYIPWREDRTPSGTMDRLTGVFFDCSVTLSRGYWRCSFFSLLSYTNPSLYPTWQHACNVLGERYLGNSHDRERSTVGRRRRYSGT